MHDQDRYSSPTTFDGFRFARANTSLKLGQRTNEIPDQVPLSCESPAISNAHLTVFRQLAIEILDRNAKLTSSSSSYFKQY